MLHSILKWPAALEEKSMLPPRDPTISVLIVCVTRSSGILPECVQMPVCEQAILSPPCTVQR